MPHKNSCLGPGVSWGHQPSPAHACPRPRGWLHSLLKFPISLEPLSYCIPFNPLLPTKLKGRDSWGCNRWEWGHQWKWFLCVERGWPQGMGNVGQRWEVERSRRKRRGRGTNPLPRALCRAPLQAGSPSLSPNHCLVLSSPFTFLLTFLPFLLPPNPRFSQLSPRSVQQLRQEARNLHSETHPPTHTHRPHP